MKKFANFYRNLPIRLKLLLVYSSILVGAALLTGMVIYSQVRNTIEANIESELSNTTATIQNMVQTSANTSIKNYLRAVAEKNREIIEDIYKRHKAGFMTEDEAQAQVSGILFSQTIGKTGYIYCANSKGIAIVHPNPGVAGKKYLHHPFVKEQIKRKEGYLEYEWENPGENRKRSKALYMTYFEPWDWIISVFTVVKIRLENDFPFRGILKVEEDEDEDVSVTVIGSHGITNIQEMLLGSVAEKVIRRARKPVLVVKR